jgi:hypothetical protein
VQFSGRTVARIHLLLVRFRFRFFTWRCRKLAGFPRVRAWARQSSPLHLRSSSRPLHCGLPRGFPFGGHGTGGQSSLVVMVEHWRARRVDSLSHTSSMNSKLNVCTTRRPFPVIALRSGATVPNTTHCCPLPSSSPPVLDT